MKRLLFIAITFSFLILPAFAVSNRLSISDFMIHSDNPKYKYMGKGISEMIAVELSKASGITLIEREKRVELLEEMEISLSDMADSETQIKVGMLLAAGYMIFGEIIDMQKEVLISLRMINIESGEVVWRDKLTEKLSNYDYISGYFASAILNNLDVKIAETTVVKIEEKKEKVEEVIIAFSKAIDHYDKKDNKEAKKELSRAKKIDPESEAVKVYLRKLVVISPKFKVESEQYASIYNPASLGLIKQDRFYTWLSNRIETDPQHVGDGLYSEDTADVINIGYAMPLGNSFGIGVGFCFGHFDNSVSTTPTTEDLLDIHPHNTGGNISIGYSILNNLSMGATLFLYNTEESSSWGKDYLEDRLNIAIDFGFIISWLDENIIFDIHSAYTTQEITYFSKNDNSITVGLLPVITEGTLTFSLLDRSLYLGLKSILDIYTDERGGYALRAIPFAEYWLFPFLAIRGAYENSHINQMGIFAMGHGFMIGSTVSIWKFDISINYTNRAKALRVLPGYDLRDDKILIGLTFYPDIFKR